MAKEFWGINRGQTEFQVVSAGADPTTNVEVVVDLAANMSREEVIEAVNMILNNIVKGKWPPA